MSQDVVSDGLNMMMNMKRARKSYVILNRYSKFLIEILKLAKSEGYVKDYNLDEKVILADFDGPNEKWVLPQSNVSVWIFPKDGAINTVKDLIESDDFADETDYWTFIDLLDRDSVDARELSEGSYLVIEQGRAIELVENGDAEGIVDKCLCSEVFVTPNGNIYECSCQLEQIGTVWDDGYEMPSFYDEFDADERCTTARRREEKRLVTVEDLHERDLVPAMAEGSMHGDLRL